MSNKTKRKFLHEKKLKAGFLNVTSIPGHIEQLRQFLAENPSYDLFGIVECWLGPVIDDNLIQIDGYSLLRQDRNVEGGGVAL